MEVARDIAHVFVKEEILVKEHVNQNLIPWNQGNVIRLLVLNVSKSDLKIFIAYIVVPIQILCFTALVLAIAIVTV